MTRTIFSLTILAAFVLGGCKTQTSSQQNLTNVETMTLEIRDAGLTVFLEAGTTMMIQSCNDENKDCKVGFPAPEGQPYWFVLDRGYINPKLRAQLTARPYKAEVEWNYSGGRADVKVWYPGDTKPTVLFLR